MSKETFETAMGKLEEIVRHLEKGDLSLEESLRAFEDGIKWSRTCEEKLNEAKGKIEMLIKSESGNMRPAPFAPSDKE